MPRSPVAAPTGARRLRAAPTRPPPPAPADAAVSGPPRLGPRPPVWNGGPVRSRLLPHRHFRPRDVRVAPPRQVRQQLLQLVGNGIELEADALPPRSLELGDGRWQDDCLHIHRQRCPVRRRCGSSLIEHARERLPFSETFGQNNLHRFIAIISVIRYVQ